MPINYSKWDKLELSDDDDFEGHPNVDKGTEVRLRQAQIHRNRKDRKVKITHLKGEVNILDFASRSLASIISTQSTPDLLIRALTILRNDLGEKVNLLNSETWENANTDRNYRWGPFEPDPMIVELHPFAAGIDKILNSVTAKLNEEGQGEADVMEHVKSPVDEEMKTMLNRRNILIKEIEELERLENAKLTSENIFKEGFSKTLISKELSDESAPIDSKGKTSIEVIHTPSSPVPKVPAVSGPTSNAAEVAEESLLTLSKPSLTNKDDDGEEDYITNPIVASFSEITTMEESFRYLMKNGDIVKEANSDQVLAEAMRQEIAGNKKSAKQCVQQSLILQYCDKLGKDGVRLFFERMKNPNHSARKLYLDDVESTYTRIANRVMELVKEADDKEKAAAAARIAAAEQPDGSYALPDFPDAPQEYKLRAEVFKSLPKEFQRALLSQNADEVNRVMLSMPKDEMENMILKCVDCGLLDKEDETSSE